jgi:nucleoside-diphosphate-sugar epimerase
MTRVLVTGATGFIGRVLCEHLAHRTYTVRAALRTGQPLPQGVVECSVVGDIGGATEWTSTLEEVEMVIHAAGRAHCVGAADGDEALYMEVNAHATRQLARAAGRAGVRRFVFLSSIKVNGEHTNGTEFRAADAADPQDAYARSKLYAEELLRDAAASSGMEVVIVRPPLVYGSGVRANFLRLLRWIDNGRPLPFGMVRNRRSLVSVWNLSSLIVKLLEDPAAAGRLWMVSDGEDLSTAELAARLARVLGRPLRMLPVPVPVLRLCGSLTGRGAEVGRLCDSLAVDIEDTRTLLGWQPPHTVDDSLRRTVAWYRDGGL